MVGGVAIEDRHREDVLYREIRKHIEKRWAQASPFPFHSDKMVGIERIPIVYDKQGQPINCYLGRWWHNGDDYALKIKVYPKSNGEWTFFHVTHSLIEECDERSIKLGRCPLNPDYLVYEKETYYNDYLNLLKDKQLVEDRDKAKSCGELMVEIPLYKRKKDDCGYNERNPDTFFYHFNDTVEVAEVLVENIEGQWFANGIPCFAKPDDPEMLVYFHKVTKEKSQILPKEE